VSQAHTLNVIILLGMATQNLGVDSMGLNNRPSNRFGRILAAGRKKKSLALNTRL